MDAQTVILVLLVAGFIIARVAIRFGARSAGASLRGGRPPSPRAQRFNAWTERYKWVLALLMLALLVWLIWSDLGS
jgi:hypothetical protein